MRRRIALIDMRKGQEGVVLELEGGWVMKQRLSAMGIKPGQKIIMTSGSFIRGPVTVRIGNAQVALGFGMARRVIVQVTAGESQ